MTKSLTRLKWPKYGFLVIKYQNLSSKMVKTAYFGRFRAKNIIHHDFFMFQDLTFTFLITKNKNLSSKIVKTAFFGHFRAKNIIHHVFSYVPGPNFYLSGLIVSIDRTQT